MTEQVPTEPTFTCPNCGRTSHHPMDVQEGYCGYCHAWTHDELVTYSIARQVCHETLGSGTWLGDNDRRWRGLADAGDRIRKRRAELADLDAANARETNRDPELQRQILTDVVRSFAEDRVDEVQARADMRSEQ